MKWPIGLIPILGLAIVVSGCAAPQGPSPSGSSPPAVSSAAAATAGNSTPTAIRESNSPQAPSQPPPSSAPRATFDGVVDAGGVSQYLHCSGQGPQTVIVVAGLHSSSRDWSEVRPRLEKIARTCVYDRPGLGKSPAREDGSSVVDAGMYARELHAALTTAGEHGPFIVVGHSFGGLVARAFIHQYQQEVVGVFLPESVTPGDPTLGDIWHEAGLDVDMTASSNATGNGPNLGNIPLLVMTASRADADHLDGPSYGQGEEVLAEWLRGQRANLKLSSNSIQVTAHSGHVLQQDDPDAVVEGLRELVYSVRNRTQLTCTDVWQTVDATCRRT